MVVRHSFKVTFQLAIANMMNRKDQSRPKTKCLCKYWYAFHTATNIQHLTNEVRPARYRYHLVSVSV